MAITRRQFVECAAGVVAAAALPLAMRPSEDATQPPAATMPACVLLDLGDECGLRESLAGYESALSALGAPFARRTALAIVPHALLIVPGALAIAPRIAGLILDAARGGAIAIVESGAVFQSDDAPALRAHRDSLRDQLQLHAGAPVSLWPTRARASGVPYAHYTWPIAATVRDFSRALPLVRHHAGDGEVIARVGDLPVALRRRIGRGTLVYLGSPLGPALRAGDADARRWMEAVVGARG